MGNKLHGRTLLCQSQHFLWLRGSKWVRALPGQKGGLPGVSLVPHRR